MVCFLVQKVSKLDARRPKNDKSVKKIFCTFRKGILNEGPPCGICRYCIGENEWSCQDGGRCIHLLQVCDGFTDCSDRSDEHEEMCVTWNCVNELIKCKDGKRCITQ